MFNSMKKKEKLKDSIKKEIIKELEKEKKIEQEKNKIVDQIELPKIEHTDEDIDAIRKSFLKIFLFSVTILFLTIMFLIVSPFEKKVKKEEPQQQIQDNEEAIKETLLTMKDGIIDNSNEELLELYFRVRPNVEEYYLYDSTYLYSKDELLVGEISEEYILYLTTKTQNFINMISEKFGETKAELCFKNGHIKISSEEINELISSIFTLDSLKEYPAFTYIHYLDGVYSVPIQFVYSDGYYVSFCQDDNFEFKYHSIAKTLINKASKEEGYIKLNIRTAFLTKDKVYADYNLTKIISDDISKDILEYINGASEYQYIFKVDNNKFRLEKIVRLS